MLVRLRRNRRFYAEPLDEQRAAVGRSLSHGAKFVSNDPTTWPLADPEHAEDDEGHGRVRVRAWRKLHARAQNYPGRGTRKTKPIIRGTLILLFDLQITQGNPQAQSLLVVVAGFWRTRSGVSVACLRQAF